MNLPGGCQGEIPAPVVSSTKRWPRRFGWGAIFGWAHQFAETLRARRFGRRLAPLLRSPARGTDGTDEVNGPRACAWANSLKRCARIVSADDQHARLLRLAPRRAHDDIDHEASIPPNPRDEREFRECARLRWHVPCRGARRGALEERAGLFGHASRGRFGRRLPGREASELGRELGPRCSTADALRCPTRSGWKPSARSSAPGRDRPVSHAKQPSTSFEVQRRRAGPDDDLTGTGWWLLHLVELQGVTRFAVPMQSAGADGHAERMT
jgi:hypothetical protein